MQTQSIHNNMNEHFYNGFIKRAQEYGLSAKTANETFDKVMSTIGFSPEMARLGKGYLDQALIGLNLKALAHPVLASGIGYGLGGAALGSLIPSRDEKGKSHRLRNALIGGLLAGGGAAATKAYNAPTDVGGAVLDTLRDGGEVIRLVPDMNPFSGPLSNERRTQLLGNLLKRVKNLNL